MAMKKTEKAERRWLLERRISARVNRRGNYVAGHSWMSRKTYRWISVGHSPPQTLEWCVQLYKRRIEEFTIRGARWGSIAISIPYRIRHVDTNETIPCEAFGL